MKQFKILIVVIAIIFPNFLFAAAQLPAVSVEAANGLLLRAVVQANDTLIRIALMGGANINAENGEGEKAIHLAAASGNLGVLGFLIGRGANINDLTNNEFQRSPLHIAVENTNLRVVQRLISHGANLNVFDARRNTPLHIAAAHGLLDITKALLTGDPNHRSTANPYLKNLKRKTSFDFAVEYQRIDIKDLFLRYIEAKAVDSNPQSQHGDPI
jgi:ankyrin repeat protein